MRIIYLEKGETVQEPTVVCLGFFDGVHIGHAKLIERARDLATQHELAVCVHTFDEMPARMLNPDADILELTPLPEKVDLLGRLGVDIVAVSTFDEEVMHMRAATFFHSILQDKLMARYIVAGFHHRFGYRGEADIEALEALCQDAGIGLEVIGPVTLTGGELVSSTAIRAAIAAGDYQKASRMLGREMHIEGRRPWI